MRKENSTSWSNMKVILAMPGSSTMFRGSGVKELLVKFRAVLTPANWYSVFMGSDAKFAPLR